MFAAVLMMTGCTKIKTNKLQGTWSSAPEYYESGYTHYGNEWYPSYHARFWVLEFVNSNTLYDYHCVYDDRTALEVDTNCDATISMPGHSGWYYDRRTPYTYVFEDNKVILSNGNIYTYMDGKLYKDGTSTVLSPW